MTYPVQEALFLAISALGLRTYDVPPQKDVPADYPFVAVGLIVANDWDTKDKNGLNFVARIHTHSRSAGMMEGRLIQGRIYDRLHNGDLPVAGYSTILLRREMTDCTRVDDGSFRGVCEYRGLIEKI